MTSKNDTKRGARRRGLAARPAPPKEKPDRRCWICPDRVPAPVTLAPATVTGGLTDEDVGLLHDPVAQDRAERWLAAAYAYQFKLAERARDAARRRMMPGPTVHVEVPDDSLALSAPTDVLDVDDLAILAELNRLAGMPAPSWLSPEAAVPLAS